MLFLIAMLQSAPILRVGVDTLEAANVVNNQPRRTGTMVRAVTRSADVFLIVTTFESERGGTSYDTLAVDVKTLAPRWQRVHFATDSAALEFKERQVTGFTHAASSGYRRVNRTLPAGTIPTQLAWSLVQHRSWPGTYRVGEYDLWRDTIMQVEYKPQRRRTVTHRGKPAEVWVVQSNHGSLLWLGARDHRMIMRRDRFNTGNKRLDVLLVRR